MEEKSRLNEAELKEVAGGANGYGSAPRFDVGDKVSLMLYPEFGVGVVKNVYMSNGVWNCTVIFDTGITDASDIEFIPA